MTISDPPSATGGIEDLPAADRAYFRAVYEQAEARFTEIVVAHGIRPGLSRALAAARVALLDEHLAPVHAMMADAGTPIVCGKGCAWCCSTTVEATPDEVFALIDHLERTLDPAALAALRERARAGDRQGHGLASIERHKLRLFCPVLDPESRACLGHAVRPAPCQGYLSLDLPRCEADYREPPGRIKQPRFAFLITSVIDGTRNAVLGDFGLRGGGLELTAALVAAWSRRDPEQAWLDGEDLFAGADYVPSSADSS